jgi:membrane protease YdiL (CAAX protease family)
MTHMPSEPWNPDRRWADPFIATLILLIVVLVGGQARLRSQRVHPPDLQVTLQGRLEDIALAGPKVLGALGRPALARKSIRVAAAETHPGWDQAVLAVHAAENGETELGQRLAQTAPGPVGATFLTLWRRSYQGGTAVPGPEDLRKVQTALGNGYAAQILEARLRTLAPDPQAPSKAQDLEAAALRWVTPRLLILGAVYAGGFLLALAGLGFGLYLALRPPQAQPLPTYRLSGRAVLIVLLGWFLTLMAAGPAVGIVLGLFPFLRPLALPLAYGLHASLGIAYLCKAEGIDLPTLWRRVTPGDPGRAAAAGFGFFALAFAAVMVVALALAPLLRHAESPQKELLDLMVHLKGPFVVTVVFLTVAVLAPAFEELLFRGFLLPWLGQRLGPVLGQRAGWALALVITAVTFGAMHMQPWGLPTLSTLGLVLGLAYVRTGNLGTAILVHGLWNGGVFLAMRLIATS